VVRQGSDRPDISERLNGSHAQSDYDALADLFLGGENGHAPSVAASQPPHSPSPESETATPVITVTTRADANRDASRGDATDSNLGMPHGPCCSRVGPIGGAATAKPACRRIDVLVLGHLPGMGGTWAAQHAHAAAQQLKSPVCLLRLSGNELVLDLIWPDDARPASFPTCTDAAAALRLAAQHAGAWLLRVQTGDEAALREWFANPAAATASDSAVDRVRLLTGADDAAIIAAYGRLKAWHAAAPHGFARLARVTIVEPDAPRAAAAESRLRKAAASFLDTELAPTERLGAMRPVRMTTLYCGPFESGARGALTLIRRISADVPQTAPATMSAEIAAEHATKDRGGSHSVADTRPDSSNTPNSGTNDAPAGPAAAASSTTGRVLAEATASRPKSAAASHVAPSASHAYNAAHAPTADQIIAMIARSAGVDTLRAAPTTCPWAPAIVLAVDAYGEAHAIAFARDEAHVSLAAVDLLTASRWCTEHASLLAMAGVTPRASDTTLHLITTAPAAARRLADTGLRVHAAVRVGENWGAVSLS
jgi:hypothetical protein